MATPRVSVMFSGEYERLPDGSKMVMLTVWLAEPPDVFAHTVNMLSVMLTVGVPLMTPSLKLRPAGRSGEMAQLEALPPETDGNSVAICTPRMRVMFSGL